MDRREILRYTAIATGAASVLPTSSLFLTGCKGDQGDITTASSLSFFSTDEMELTKQIIDVILPKTLKTRYILMIIVITVVTSTYYLVGYLEGLLS